MVFNIHAGHGAVGSNSIGAVGFLNESREDRIVKNEVIRQLQLLGHKVYDCTVDDGKNAADILTKIVAKCNAHDVDLDVSIHFNAGANDRSGNGKTTGTECFIYDNKSTQAKDYAVSIVNSIAKLGFKNRGVKVNSNLYFLKYTKSQAVLIECCFVDDKDDAEVYDARKMAEAIVFGLTGQKYTDNIVIIDKAADEDDAETAQGKPDAIYRVQVGAFKNMDNAKELQKRLTNAGFSAFITKA